MLDLIYESMMVVDIKRLNSSFVFFGSENKKKNSLWNTVDMVCFTWIRVNFNSYTLFSSKVRSLFGLIELTKIVIS